jgi:hypothetical protein
VSKPICWFGKPQADSLPDVAFLISKFLKKECRGEATGTGNVVYAELSG